jgi:hypothetical protein
LLTDVLHNERDYAPDKNARHETGHFQLYQLGPWLTDELFITLRTT